MPEQSRYPNESQEHYKQRIKKLKARTSKMRLAVVTEKKWSATGLSPKDAERKRAEIVKKQEYLKLDPKTNKNKINNIYEAAVKKKKKDDEGDIDSDREMQRERDMERLQASAETGGDY